MTPEQIETELKHLATKEDLALLSAGFEKRFGDFKTDLYKTLWLTQLTTIAIILVGVGLLIHFHL